MLNLWRDSMVLNVTGSFRDFLKVVLLELGFCFMLKLRTLEPNRCIRCHSFLLLFMS